MNQNEFREGFERLMTASQAAKKAFDKRGILWDMDDLHKAIVFATDLEIVPKAVSCEQLTVSKSAELVCDGPTAYAVNVSADFLKGTANPRDALFDLVKKGEMFITLSELARAKSQTDLVIRAGQRVALRDPVTDGGHLIYALFINE